MNFGKALGAENHKGKVDTNVGENQPFVMSSASCLKWLASIVEAAYMPTWSEHRLAAPSNSMCSVSHKTLSETYGTYRTYRTDWNVIGWARNVLKTHSGCQAKLTLLPTASSALMWGNVGSILVGRGSRKVSIADVTPNHTTTFHKKLTLKESLESGADLIET